MLRVVSALAIIVTLGGVAERASALSSASTPLSAGSSKGSAASTASTSSSPPRPSSPSPPRRSFSNRDKLDQLLVESEYHSSPNFPRTWVPLAAIDHLDTNRPTPLQFLGANYVCYYSRHQQNDTNTLASEEGDANKNNNWVVMDDACPHRLAPLSEGRLEHKKDTTTVIECAYHGWQFDQNGNCQRIPQMNDDTFQKAVRNPRSCVASYPVVVEKGMLWAWLWSDDPLSVAGLVQAHPEGMAHGIPDAKGSAYMRDMPYGWDTLLENLMDPSHVPFAHHGLQGTRDDAIPINMTLTGDITEYGFRVEFEDRTMKNFRKGFGELRAPYLLHYQGNYYDENGQIKTNVRPFSLSTYCIPTRPGWSRLVVVAGSMESDEISSNKSGGDKDGKKKKPSLITKVFKLIPPWVVHILSGRFLDSDLAFLHYQEREARVRAAVNGHDQVAKSYFMPAPSDLSVSHVRGWVRKYARAWELLPLPASPANRDELFDRYNQHVKHCRHCQGALQGLKTWKRNSFFVLGASVIGMQATPVAAVSAVGSLLMLPVLNVIERAITEGGYEHYKT